MKSLSVIIPTRGTHRIGFLEACLASVLRADSLTTLDQVVVVVDGGDFSSYDRLRTKFFRVQFIWQPPAGPASARNRGLNAVDSELVAFLDDDVVVSIGWLTDLQEIFLESPGLAALGGAVHPEHEKNLVSAMMRDMGHLDHRLGPNGWLLITANAVFLRQVVLDVGGFDEGFTAAAGEDLDLSQRVLELGHRIEVTTKAAVLHRHPETIREMLRSCHRYFAGSAPGTRIEASCDETGCGAISQLPERGAPHVAARVVAFSRHSSVPAKWRRLLEVTACRVAWLPKAPSLIRLAHRAPAQQSWRAAIGIAGLELLWRAEWLWLTIDQALSPTADHHT